MVKKVTKVLIGIFISFGLLSFLLLAFYLKGLPALVQSPKIISCIEKIAKTHANLDIKIVNPILITELSPKLQFSVDYLFVKKNSEKILFLNDFAVEISLEDVIKHKIIVNKFGADVLFVDASKLLSLFPSGQKNEETKQSNWSVDLFDSILFLNKSFISYQLTPDTIVDLSAKNLCVDNTQKVERFVHFDFNADIKKDGKVVSVAFKDDNKVVIKNKHIYVNDCPLTINNSKMFFNAKANQENKFEVEVYSKKFYIQDVINLLQTNVIENNIGDILPYFKNLNGDFDFKIKLTNDDLNGNINFNKISTELVPLSNLPVIINSGDISLTSTDLSLKNFEGYYNHKKENDFKFEGSVKDYLKSIDTNIDMTITLTNDFVQEYLSKTAGIPLSLVGKSRAKLVIKSKNMDLDIMMAGKLNKGDDILVDGASLSPTSYDRALKADLHLKGNNLNIESINYYIAKEINRASKGIKPILTLNGNVDVLTGKLFDVGFDIPNPLPSEFLNVLIGQKLFKKGKFSGNIHYWDNNGNPKLSGNMTAEKILVPSQRLFLRKGSFSADEKLLNLSAEGRYKRAKYEFTGNIVNSLLFPIVVKNTKLTIDNIDVERMMQVVNAPIQSQEQVSNVVDNIESEEDIENSTDEVQTFDFKNLIIEECIVNILNGKYKDINFANIQANMSLDKNSVFRLKSNRFDIAEGISSADVNCDLKNKKYSLRLGIKDVNSDLMSTSILNLSKEITGKASGILDLNTDESLKLNGIIKFIVKDGSIPKVGLIEYVFKFASLFRNPIAMISPSVFSDLVNVPEGNFDRITGDLKLKDNRIELMKIKSSSPQLASYIVGCYDLENSDAILRIYTKFTNKRKGFAGFLRNISLNSLANKMPLRSRNDINYYASELAQIPDIDADDEDCQIFLTKVDGDVEHNNFISSLKKIK